MTRVLNFLGRKSLKSEVNLIIWEVDDDFDGSVSNDVRTVENFPTVLSSDFSQPPLKLSPFLKNQITLNKPLKLCLPLRKVLNTLPMVSYSKERVSKPALNTRSEDPNMLNNTMLRLFHKRLH